MKTYIISYWVGGIEHLKPIIAENKRKAKQYATTLLTKQQQITMKIN